jgi:type IV pilus assembly protein PilW
MKAIYGVASATSCLDVVTKAPYPCPITAWVDPSQGTWTLASLTNTGIGGNATANAQIFEIKAVRIGLIMRSPLKEKTAVTTAPVTLFNNLNPAYGTPYVKNFAGNEQYYRYRTVEATIPVRNNLIP